MAEMKTLTIGGSTFEVVDAAARASVALKLDATELPNAVDDALAEAKASGDFKGDKGDTGEAGPQGVQGYGYVTSVSRPSFTEANWNTYGEVGHEENWSDTSDIRNGCRIGDVFTVVGTATDTGNAHVIYYRCDNASGNLHGVCFAHSVANRGATGATGEAGPQGPQGDAGANATITNATASVTATTGTPTVTVTVGGTESARTFDFAFSGIKGEKGDTGEAGSDANLPYTYGTTDMTAGTSALATGTLYFVYE